LKQQLEVASKQIEELKKQKSAPPTFVKANVIKPKAEEKEPRKRCDARHNQARRRAVPTQIVEHRIVMCPDCDLRLGGISLARCREVIDIPPSTVVQITEHRIFKGWCAGCQKWHEVSVDLHEQVLGWGRIGVRLASSIAYLRTSFRLPIRQIREVLRTLNGFEVSSGRTRNLGTRQKASVKGVLST
jgi:transposase